MADDPQPVALGPAILPLVPSAVVLSRRRSKQEDRRPECGMKNIALLLASQPILWYLKLQLVVDMLCDRPFQVPASVQSRMAYGAFFAVAGSVTGLYTVGIAASITGAAIAESGIAGIATAAGGGLAGSYMASVLEYFKHQTSSANLNGDFLFRA
jgi:hypothetical protein